MKPTGVVAFLGLLWMSACVGEVKVGTEDDGSGSADRDEPGGDDLDAGDEMTAEGGDDGDGQGTDDGGNETEDGGDQGADLEQGSKVILWDTNKRYLDKNPFGTALNDRASWTQVPYGRTDYTFVGDAMVESDFYYLFPFSNDEDSPTLAAKRPNAGVVAIEIYKVHDTGYRNFGMGNMWVKILTNSEQEVVLQSAEKGMRFGDPPVPITSEYRIDTRPWLEVRPVANMNQQGQHDKRRFVAFVYDDVSRDVILDAKKHEPVGEDVYPEAGCRGFLIFHRGLNDEHDFMWFMTFPPGAEGNALTYAGIHYPDPYWERDCRGGNQGCAPSIGATYVYLEQKVIIAPLTSKDDWKREDPNLAVAAGQIYQSTFTAPYAGKWRMAAIFSDDDWNVTDYFSEVTVAKDEPFSFTSPRAGTLQYLILYLFDRTAATPADVYTPMDVYRAAIGTP